MAQPLHKMTLSEIIKKILVEELGKVKKSSGRGYGTQQPYTIQADKPMLGYVENESLDDSDSYDTNKRVKISRAFLESSS